MTHPILNRIPMLDQVADERDRETTEVDERGGHVGVLIAFAMLEYHLLVEHRVPWDLIAVIYGMGLIKGRAYAVVSLQELTSGGKFFMRLFRRRQLDSRSRRILAAGICVSCLDSCSRSLRALGSRTDSHLSRTALSGIGLGVILLLRSTRGTGAAASRP